MFKKFFNIRFRSSTNNLVSDSFIKRLPVSVIGEAMLHKGNIKLIESVICRLPENGNVIEIGCYGGLSTNLICHLLHKYKKNNAFFTCDAWVYEGFNDYKGLIESHVDGREDLSRTDYMLYIKNAFIQATLFLSKHCLPKTYHLTANEFFFKWAQQAELIDVFGNKNVLGGGICFAYIDGDHSYNSVKDDFKNINKFLIKGGYILFDDSAEGLKMGSSLFMKEMKQNVAYKVIDKKPNYLFQKIS